MTHKQPSQLATEILIAIIQNDHQGNAHIEYEEKAKEVSKAYRTIYQTIMNRSEEDE